MKATRVFALALLAATTLLTACSDDDDPKPLPFEERGAAFFKAVDSDPQREEKMSQLNEAVMELYLQVIGMDVEEIASTNGEGLQRFALANGFTLTLDEAKVCCVYLLQTTLGTSGLRMEIATFDMLSDNAKAFVNSFDPQKLREMVIECKIYVDRLIMETLLAADPNHELFDKGSEALIGMAEEYGITFSPDESRQLLRSILENIYYHGSYLPQPE